MAAIYFELTDEPEGTREYVVLDDAMNEQSIELYLTDAQFDDLKAQLPEGWTIEEA